MVSGMRYQALAFAIALSMLGCESKKSTASEQPVPKPTAALTDLTAASTLAPVRAAFNAKKGEARFLTLLSPT